MEAKLKNDDWVYKIGSCPKIKKYSQSGEEGYLKYILDNIDCESKFIVDIGAWDGEYLSNTKFFTDYLGYESLLIDGDNRGNIEVKKEWITKNNVCDILKKYNCPTEYALLSYDTDGNDFWILNEILIEYRPAVVICEINGTIPAGISKTIQYNPNHIWNNDDYYGFSFHAGIKLAELNGYKAVFQNDSLNLYLVAKEKLADPNIIIDIPFSSVQYHPHNNTGTWINI